MNLIKQITVKLPTYFKLLSNEISSIKIIITYGTQICHKCCEFDSSTV